MRRARILIARANGPNASRVASSLLNVEEVSEMTELITALVNRRPAVLLISTDFPGLGGPSGLRGIRRLSPATRIIVLSSSINDQEELDVLRMGAKGYCGNVEADVLLKMIDKVQQGEIWAARKTIGALLDEFYGAGGEAVDIDPLIHQRLEALTPREREILRTLAAGASNKEIAISLNVTVATVKAHLTKMFRKLGHSDRLHLALYAAAVNRSAP